MQESCAAGRAGVAGARWCAIPHLPGDRDHERWFERIPSGRLSSRAERLSSRAGGDPNRARSTPGSPRSPRDDSYTDDYGSTPRPRPAAVRAAEFPWTDDTIYLNNASIGPLPERTRLALEEFNRRRAAPFQLPDRDLFGMLAQSRRRRLA